MSTPHWVKSRGFTITAAIFAAAILTVTAAIVQMAVPAPIDHLSQGAAIGVPANPADGVESSVEEVRCAPGTRCIKPAAPKTKPAAKADTVTQPCVPGYDFTVDEKLDDKTGKTGAPVVTKWPVCDGSSSVTRDAPIKGSVFGTNDGRCVLDSTTGNLIPDPSKQWQCKKVWCVPKSIQILKPNDKGAENAAGFWGDPTDPTNPDAGTICWDVKDSKPGAFDVNTVRAQGAVQVLPFLDPGDRKDAAINLNFGAEDPALNKAMADAFKEEVKLATEDLKVVQDNKAEQIKFIAACTGASKDDPAQCGGFDEAAAKAKLEEIKKEEARLKEQLDYLGKTQKELDPAANPDPKKKTVTDPPPGERPGGPGYTPPSGGVFGNPSMNGNSGPQSPFGGACNTRYVCQGNTLYYQAQNGQQCMTQPMQQCQFGCQPVAGTSGTAGSSGQGGLGSIVQMLPAITSVLNMFGGGNGSSVPMANANLSSSCATQPQNQYGTGTNGQACSQPPQQPDASQCTSGTWKATSATQNGCTTGWQCVPSSASGAGSTQPTAQLSCQPKTADVGMQIGFSWSCGNSSGSAGTGFDTGGQLSGSTTSVAPTPPAGTNNTATYTLTCINLGVTASAQCQVQIGSAGIVAVANPQKVRVGGTAQIGWISSGMQSCVVSSPDQNDFTQRNLNTANTSGAAQTSPIAKSSQFVVNCTTVGGQTKTASVTVEMY